MKIKGELMYKILIDSSLREHNSIKLIKSQTGEVVDEIVGNIDLVTSLKEILEKHGLKVGDIEHFESFKGPGSFTGLKKSFAITNVLNWVNGRVSNVGDVELPDYGREPNIG